MKKHKQNECVFKFIIFIFAWDYFWKTTKYEIKRENENQFIHFGFFIFVFFFKELGLNDHFISFYTHTLTKSKKQTNDYHSFSKKKNEICLCFNSLFVCLFVFFEINLIIQFHLNSLLFLFKIIIKIIY